MSNKYYFGIEEIVSNSFIELNKIDNVRQIPLSVAEKYGQEVINYLKKDNSMAFMILSRNATNHFENEYSDYFYIEDSIVFLKDNIKIEDLIDKFRGYLNIKLLMAFINEEVVSEGLYDNFSCYLQEKVNNINTLKRVKK